MSGDGPTQQPCTVHNRHEPTPLLVELHHIQPLGMGGADSSENKVAVCVGGHYNIHELLADLIRTGQMRRRGGSSGERQYAQQGYDAWIAAGKPGRPVYEGSAP